MKNRLRTKLRKLRNATTSPKNLVLHSIAPLTDGSTPHLLMFGIVSQKENWEKCTWSSLAGKLSFIGYHRDESEKIKILIPFYSRDSPLPSIEYLRTSSTHRKKRLSSEGYVAGAAIFLKFVQKFTHCNICTRLELAWTRLRLSLSVAWLFLCFFSKFLKWFDCMACRISRSDLSFISVLKLTRTDYNMVSCKYVCLFACQSRMVKKSNVSLCHECML